MSADWVNDLASVGEYRLRCWTSADATALAAAWQDEDIARWNPVPDDTSEAAARRWIERHCMPAIDGASVDLVVTSATRGSDPRVALEFAESQADPVIGEIGLRIDPSRMIGEIGFWLDASYRGRQISGSLLGLCRVLVAAVGSPTTVAVVDAKNVAAKSSINRVGWPEVQTRPGSGVVAFQVPVG